MSDFELGLRLGTLDVRSPDGAVRAVRIPDGVDPVVFRNVVSAVDTAFRTVGVMPSLAEARKVCPQIPKSTFARVWKTDEFVEALEARGVQVDPDAGLHPLQQAALVAITDFTSTKTLKAKLESVGATPAQHQAWMKNPLYAEAYRERTEAQFREAVPTAMNALLSNVEKGDQRAIEKVLEITGRYNPNQRDLENARVVIVTLVEALQRHVKDPEIMKAILEDVNNKASVAALMQ